MSTVNEYLVKISAGKIPISKELKLGEEVTLVIQGDVTKSEDLDNQDGTFNRVYTVKGIILEEMEWKQV